MTTKEVAEKLVGYCRKGDFESAYKELYSPEIESIEPEGSPTPYAKGMDEVMKKSEQFGEMVEEMFGNEVSDPLVADNYFCCSMEMDVQFKGMGRIKMGELCLYEVKDGKIVKEQFFYEPE